MKEKVQDLIVATKGVIGEILVEDAVPALAKEMLRGTVVEAASGAIGMISPRIGGVMVAYQQRRWERNWEKYIQLIYERQEMFNERLNGLENSDRLNFKEKAFPLVSDFVQNEKQEEKIEMIVNGLINISNGINGQEDIILMFYETLEQLSLLDLRILKLYIPQYIDQERDDNIWKLMEECGIDDSQARMVKEKLEHLGLLQSQNEKKINDNIENVIQYVEDISKGKKNPKLKHIKSVTKSETYKITSFGIKFINFFTKIYENGGFEQ